MTAAQAGSVDSSAGPAFAVPQLSDDTAVWLVRHGETEWSKSGQHTGVSDLPLTADGERQGAAVAQLLTFAARPFVLCSPRARARETARLAGLEVDEICADLAEWDYGTYEGRTSVEIQRDVPDWTIWTHGAPGGESAAQVQARADRVLTRVCEHTADGPVVLVGHGHFSRAVGARWIGLPVTAGANLLLGTAAPCLLGAQHGAPAIVRWNLPNPVA